MLNQLNQPPQTNPQPRIVAAARALDFDRVISYAAAGDNINATFNTEQATNVTPLLHLVTNIDSFLVTKSVTQRQIVQQAGQTRQVVTTHTSQGLSKDIFAQVQKMVELNAKVDAKFGSGETPLLLAAQQYPMVQGQTNLAKKQLLNQLIEFFVAKGANLDVADSNHFKKGLMLKALELAGKDPQAPVAQPRELLFNAIAKGLAQRAKGPEEMFAEQDFECPISYEQMENPVRTPAGHVFEKSELEDWLSKHTTCPTCDEKLTLGANGNVVPAEDLKIAIDARANNEFITKDEAQRRKWQAHGLN